MYSSSNSPDDMQNRIDRLESLVLSLMTNGSQSAGPAAGMAAISGTSSAGSARHANDVDVNEDGPGGPEDSDTEQVTKSFGIMKFDNNKSYYISDAHWGSVLHEVRQFPHRFSLILLTLVHRYQKCATILRLTRSRWMSRQRGLTQQSRRLLSQARHFFLVG